VIQCIIKVAKKPMCYLNFIERAFYLKNEVINAQCCRRCGYTCHKIIRRHRYRIKFEVMFQFEIIKRALCEMSYLKFPILYLRGKNLYVFRFILTTGAFIHSLSKY
jgi:hypothetical protein